MVEWSLPTPKICGSNPSKFYLSIVLHLNRKDKKRKSGWERPIFKKLNDHIIIKKESYLETYSVGREEGSGLTDKPKKHWLKTFGVPLTQTMEKRPHLNF